MTKAVAHPNIALVKYWGKQDRPGNLPVTPNLSLTLDGLMTETDIRAADTDRLVINGVAQSNAKIAQFLATLRDSYDIPPIEIVTTNNFPTGAGLASSASGFAALMIAINQHCNLGLSTAALSTWARQGSASAARSFYGGYVSLTGPDWQAASLAPASHWPVNIVVAITSERTKLVGSTEGMRRTAATSPFFDTWVKTADTDYTAAAAAIQARDFTQLAAIAEHNCLKMHSIMLTSKPSLSYWNGATVACMDTVRSLRDEGLSAFFTIDAGPQVKVICTPAHSARVQNALANTPGVLTTYLCGLGDGARIIE